MVGHLQSFLYLRLPPGSSLEGQGSFTGKLRGGGEGMEGYILV